MQVNFLGAQHIKGKKKDGGTYDFAQLFIVTPIRNESSSNRTVVGFGSEVQTLNIDASILDQFRDVSTGSLVDLDIQPDPSNINRNRVVGVLAKKAS